MFKLKKYVKNFNLITTLLIFLHNIYTSFHLLIIVLNILRLYQHYSYTQLLLSVLF